MKLYKLKCDNYYHGNKTFIALANSQEQAFEVLKQDTEFEKYYKDDETGIIGWEEINLDYPKIIK